MVFRVNRVNIQKNDCRKKIFYNNSLNVVNSTGCYCGEYRKVISAIVLQLTLHLIIIFHQPHIFVGLMFILYFRYLSDILRISGGYLKDIVWILSGCLFCPARYGSWLWAEKIHWKYMVSSKLLSNGCLSHSYGQRKFNKINNYIKIQVKISARQLLFIRL